MKQEGLTLHKELDTKDQIYVDMGPEGAMPSDAALGALLEEGCAADAEGRVRRLGERVARLDALNVGGMLAAASEGGGAGARLADRLDAGLAAGTALAARLRRCEAVVRSAPDAAHARSGAARTDASARALLAELEALYGWLDAPPLRDLDELSEISLAAPEGRARALAAALALRGALRAEGGAPLARRRLAAVRERVRRLTRARDALAACLARHLNNALIHLGNEAAQDGKRRHHAELLPYAPFMRWLKDMDERAFDGLAKVYTSTWARVYEREVHAGMEAARAALTAAPPDQADPILDNVLTLIESLCDAEQDFCTQFFYLDIDVKSDGSDGERSERSDGGERSARAGQETRRFMSSLLPALEQELGALVQHVERRDKYGAMRALACLSRRVVGEGGVAPANTPATLAGEARWARAALAGGAVAAKRQADRAVAERLAALPDAVKQAAKRPKCGLLSFIKDFEELSVSCERIFAGGRRADLDRWYVSLGNAMVHAVQHADHPRTPRAVVHMENFHRLHGVVSLVRAGSLEPLRRECKARYAAALRAYVTQYFGRPLEKLTLFFEGVSECVSGGVREDEVCYRAAYSKHELKRLLALYPAHEVRKSLHRLYRTVEKHLSEEGGLLQVVWRAMQEEFLAQTLALQSRIATCYAGAGLSMPLTTQDILDAFSDIAREH